MVQQIERLDTELQPRALPNRELPVHRQVEIELTRRPYRVPSQRPDPRRQHLRPVRARPGEERTHRGQREIRELTGARYWIPLPFGCGLDR